MNGITKAMRLFDIISYDTTRHFADQMNLNPIDLCEMIVSNNTDWASRSLDEDNYYCLSDITHDFIGLVNKDDHFVTRL